nr:Fimbrin-2 like [Ipomoea batatas]
MVKQKDSCLLLCFATINVCITWSFDGMNLTANGQCCVYELRAEPLLLLSLLLLPLVSSLPSPPAKRSSTSGDEASRGGGRRSRSPLFPATLVGEQRQVDPGQQQIDASLLSLMRFNMLQLLKNLRSHSLGKEITDADILDWANSQVKSSGRHGHMASFKVEGSRLSSEVHAAVEMNLKWIIGMDLKWFE